METGYLPYIPEFITVHLGPPDSDAENVTVSFPDYIKNVASSEIYPTWPENAVRANVLAEISFALNRVYTEFYRSRGYDFDITNSTAADQSFVKGREVFENISRITDELFTSYIRRAGATEPLFAVYCDGREVTCDGLSQWGTVDLARAGYSVLDILRTYYGNDITVVDEAPVQGLSESYPGSPLRIGDVGNGVFLTQVRLNRIRRNYPAIPRIAAEDGVFGADTDRAVRAFQRIFSLAEDGIVGRGTWYRVAEVYTAVKRLSDLNSEGLSPDELFLTVEGLSEGERGGAVRELQYLLNYVAEFVDEVPSIEIDGIFGPLTKNALESFQRVYELPVTGVVDGATKDLLFGVYRGILESLPREYSLAAAMAYPGTPLSNGYRGDAASSLQEYLNFAASVYPSVPRIAVDGVFGQQTERAVREFQRAAGLPGTGVADRETWDALAEIYRRGAPGRT